MIEKEPKTFDDLWLMRETSKEWFDGQLRYENVRKEADPEVGMVDSVSWHVAPSSDRVSLYKSTHVICEVRQGGRSLSCRVERETVAEYRSMDDFRASEWWDLTMEKLAGGDADASWLRTVELDGEEVDADPIWIGYGPSTGRVSDEERREVAARLHKQAEKLGPNMDAHEFANYTADVLDVDESMTWYEMELRLADLIEPSEPKVKCVAEVKVDGERLEKLVHDAVVELTGIDRDELLRIADDMDAYTECDDERCGKEMPPSVIHGYARRIRKALGVER